jgi:hypothetical protein
MLDLIGKYAGMFVTTALGSWVGVYLSSYLKKKGENLATHEDIDKLIDQVSAVTTTTKQIEAKISNEMWQRERKCELQLKAIASVNAMTSEYIQRVIADPSHRPSLEWFSSFSAADAVVKALFDEETYAIYKNLEKRIGPGLGSTAGSTFAVSEFIEARDAAVKVMYSRVIGYTAAHCNRDIIRHGNSVKPAVWRGLHVPLIMRGCIPGYRRGEVPPGCPECPQESSPVSRLRLDQTGQHGGRSGGLDRGRHLSGRARTCPRSYRVDRPFHPQDVSLPVRRRHYRALVW